MSNFKAKIDTIENIYPDIRYTTAIFAMHACMHPLSLSTSSFPAFTFLYADSGLHYLIFRVIISIFIYTEHITYCVTF